MIQYPYTPSKVLDGVTRRYVLLHRPLATALVSGSGETLEVTALVDTGADDTLLPSSFVGPLGVTLRSEDSDVIVGIDGGSLTIWHAIVNLELVTPGGGPRWSARVGFYFGAKPILGHAGFLDHFTAKFNGRAKTLTLTPNGTAPPATRFEG